MGEIEVSSRTGEELVARGLGSCIGLALFDRQSGIAGMAHVVLPESSESDAEPGKFADLAVPALIAQLQKAGAVQRRLEAVLAGGARMFELGEMDIGARNAAAVKAGLARSGIAIRAADTGGNRGRTMRLTVGEFTVTVKEAGGETSTLFDGTTAPRGAGSRATASRASASRATGSRATGSRGIGSRPSPRAAAPARPTLMTVSAVSAAWA